MIIFPIFHVRGNISPFFKSLLVSNKKIKIIKFKMMTEHIAGLFLSNFRKIESMEGITPFPWCFRGKEENPLSRNGLFPVFSIIFPPKSNVSSFLTK